MSSFRTVFVVLADAVVLLAARPDPAALHALVVDPAGRTDSLGADRVLADLAGGALWLVAARVAVGLLALTLTGGRGAGARLATTVVRVALPVAVLRLLAGSAGLGVLLAPVCAADAAAVVRGGDLPGPAWPTTAPATTPPTTPAAEPPPRLPGPAWPASPPPGRTASPAGSGGSTTEPAPRAQRATTVDVRPGDCLWSIATHRLGPPATVADVAAYVTRLYAANRSVVGADPDLVRPGLRLTLAPDTDLTTVDPPPVPRPQESG